MSEEKIHYINGAKPQEKISEENKTKLISMFETLIADTKAGNIVSAVVVSIGPMGGYKTTQTMEMRHATNIAFVLDVLKTQFILAQLSRQQATPLV